MTQKQYLQLLPRGLWGVCHPQNIISGLFIVAEQNGYIKIMIGCVLGLVALQSLSAIKKGTRPLNFQFIEPLLKFLRQLLQYKVPWSKTKKNYNK